MIFDPIKAADFIDSSFKDYVFNTFVIRDADFRNQYRKQIEKGMLSKGPYLDCVDSFKGGKSLSDLIQDGTASVEFREVLTQSLLDRSLYLHQEQAFKSVSSGMNTVITTGTGSGKTECFMYPVLDDLFREKEAGILCPGVRTLLLYPMNALANDQMKRLREILGKYPNITFGSFTGETEEKENAAIEKYVQTFGKKPAPNELISREKIRETPPNILVTNYAMLEYLLLRPKDNVFFDGRYASYWRHIVLDEAHVYSGATGMEVSMLMRRVFHRIKDNSRVSFILTSATLGEKDKNRQICSFATNLCAGQPFLESCIIRATRKTITRPDHTVLSEVGWLEKTSALLERFIDGDTSVEKQLLDEFESVYPGISDSRNLPVKMFECLSHEALLHDVRELLRKDPMPVRSMAKHLNRENGDIIGLIRLASYANKDNSKLMDARYHHFVRTLEGAHVSFYPKKTLTLTNRDHFECNGESWLCFMISVCQFCGAIYLIGDRVNDMFIQDEPRMRHRQYFMVVENDDFFKENSSDEDLREKAWFVDCGTGRMRPYRPNEKKDREIIVVEANTEEGKITRCLQCDTTSGVRGEGVIRGFYLGQDASSSVVCDALYEQIPERKVKETEVRRGALRRGPEQPVEERARRLLSFADSRQEAAFFASYMQYTHDKISERRLLIEAIRKAENASFATVFRYLVGLLRHHSFDSPTAKAMLIILSEFRNFSRNNLMNTGWIRVKLKDEYYLPENETIELENGPSVTGGQINSILDFMVGYVIKQAAVYYEDDISFTLNDFLEFSFGGKQPVVRKINDGNANRKYEECYLIPGERYSNSILEYIRKQGFGKDDARIILKTMVDEFFMPDTAPGTPLLRKYCHDPNVLVLDSYSLEFQVQGRTPFTIYRCSSCNRLTTIRGNLSCPTYKCEGRLEEIPFEEKGYFIKQYAIDRHYLKMTVKEHTAQLGKDTAREYQQDFVNGKTNVLSCSTTFEMGVDVGDLETVFMKNMPPRPSNYVQRAGRAGRRIDSAAFSLTFCRLASHDFYFFEKPSLMIKGVINPPAFKIDNPKIVFRHVYSILLNAYWKDLYPAAKNVSEIFREEDAFSNIQTYLLNDLPDSTREYIKNVVPASLSDRIDDEIARYATELLKFERDAYVGTLNELSCERQKILDRMQAGESNLTGKLSFIEKAKTTFEDQQIIQFYSRKNLLPKYGFPVDTVELQTEAYASKDGTLSLQRDLIQAITEYAPDSEVIADGKIYRSRYVLKPRSLNKTWTIHIVSRCEACKHVSVQKVFTGEEKLTKTDCTFCGASHSVSRSKMILPLDGFATENGDLEIAKTRRPNKEKRSEFYYIGDANPENNEEARVFNLNGYSVRVLTSPNDELLVMNTTSDSGFSVCERCGFATLEYVNKMEHRNKKDDKCKGTFGHYSIGHEFRTDVVLLHFDGIWLDPERIRTLMYALLKGASIKYDIAEDDIDGCISYSNYIEGNPTGFNIILFDSIPGGAGNVKRIADSDEDEFRDFLMKCYENVRNCTCGDKENGDSSCYGCLRTYRNQYYHQVIKRIYAVGFLGELLGEATTL